MTMIKTRLRWVSIYFLIAGVIGLVKMGSIDTVYKWFSLDILIGLTFALVYLYCGLRLKSLLPKWKSALQTLIAFTITSNLIHLYFGAGVNLSETDTLGKILTILIFILPILLGGYIIYQIEILSNHLSQPYTEESTNNETLIPIQPRAQGFLSNKYFLIFTPLLVVVVCQAISAVAFYLPVSQATSEKMIIYPFWGVIIYAATYCLSLIYWLIKRQYKQMGYTLIGLFGGFLAFYIISVYVFIYLP